MIDGESDARFRVALVSQAVLFDRPSFTALAQSGIDLISVPSEATPAEFADALRGCSAIIAGAESYTRELMSALPELQIIARSGVGYDQIDLGAANDLGIFVTATTGVNSAGVAEHALALLLALMHQVIHYDTRVREGFWRDGNFYRELRGLTVGLVGFGSIGQALANLLQPFGVHLAIYDPFIDPTSIARDLILAPNLESMLPQCQVLSIHVPLIPETRYLIGARELALLPEGAFVINTSRGGVLDETALATELRTGHLAGAALDVLEQEPPKGRNELLEFPNCLFSPHIASFGHSTIAAMSDMIAGQVLAARAGETPLGLVNSPKGHPSL